MIGPSSEFVDAANNFIQESGRPLNVIFHSDGMSKSIYSVVSFSEEISPFTDMNYMRVENRGGNDLFLSTQQQVTPLSLSNISVKPILQKARTTGLFSLYSSNYIDEMQPFAIKVPDSHVSTMFFGLSPTRPGYILNPGNDEDDIFFLNENRGEMTIHTDEISSGQDYFYFFSESDNYSPMTGYYGMEVNMMKEREVPPGAYLLQ